MQITSMSNRELLYLLTGQKCNGVMSNEVRDMIYSTPVSPESYWGKINKDRFESSDSVVFEGSSSGDGKKTDRFEYSGNDDIDFNDKAVQWEIDLRTHQEIFSHLTSSRQSTRPFIAEYFGRVA
ncbi:MAG: hypothetical protein K2H23_06950 [Oscillospiraceae bacterium]|nr:hypothetical protein [Oscillospiraceae bacterium]